MDDRHPPPVTDTAPEARAWLSVARPLAAWVWAHLVNRTDVWGGYFHPDRRPVKTRADGSTYPLKSFTAPRVVDRARVRLTPGRVAQHFAARHGGDVIGLHSTAPALTCRWVAWDLDRHGDQGDPDANRRAAVFWYDALVSLGLSPWLVDSNGAGGYHLRVVFAEPVPSAVAYKLGRWLVRDHKEHGLADPPEAFPKQASLPAHDGRPGYGYWLRLPGRHHTRDHWSRFWTGSEWVGGGDAVNVILSTTPDSPSLIPDIPDPPAPAGGSKPRARGFGPGRFTDRQIALFCLDAVDNGGQGVPYDMWVEVGMALHNVDPSPAMLAEWVGWSRRSAKHTDGQCEYKWRSFGAGRGITLGTLVALARRAGKDPFARAKPDRPKPIRLGLTTPPRAAAGTAFTVLPNRGANG